MSKPHACPVEKPEPPGRWQSAEFDDEPRDDPTQGEDPDANSDDFRPILRPMFDCGHAVDPVVPGSFLLTAGAVIMPQTSAEAGRFVSVGTAFHSTLEGSVGEATLKRKKGGGLRAFADHEKRPYRKPEGRSFNNDAVIRELRITSSRSLREPLGSPGSVEADEGRVPLLHRCSTCKRRKAGRKRKLRER